MGSLPVNAMVRSVAVDPLTPQRVYATGPDGLFRSNDGGLTWDAADEGLTGEPLAVTLNPAAPETVFALLDDGSIWQSNDAAKTWALLEEGS